VVKELLKLLVQNAGKLGAGTRSHRRKQRAHEDSAEPQTERRQNNRRNTPISNQGATVSPKKKLKTVPGFDRPYNAKTQPYSTVEDAPKFCRK